MNPSFDSFKTKLQIYFDASCEYLYYKIHDYSPSTSSKINPLSALACCLNALSSGSFSTEKKILVEELEKLELGFSSQSFDPIQRDYEFNPSFSQTFQPLITLDKSEEMTDSLPRTIPNLISLRRGSVSAECISNPTGSSSNSSVQDSSKTHYPKSKASRLIIQKAISSNILFRELDEQQLAEIISCMFERPTLAEEVIIKQGDSGDYFYIVEKGSFEVFVDSDKRNTLNEGTCFGELALLYNSPRMASVVSRTTGLLWAIERLTFRKIVINHNYHKRKRYEIFLKNIPILSTLSQIELSKLSDCLKPCSYEQNQIVIKQGDAGNSFYIITEGSAEVKINDHVDRLLGPGDYFGEMSLITRNPRAATVVAYGGPLSTLRLDTDAFDRLLGPLVNVMKQNMSLYNQYTS